MTSGRTNWRSGANWRMHLSRDGSRRVAHTVNTIRLIRLIDSCRASWNDGGTRDWKMFVHLRSKLLNTMLSGLSCLAQRISDGCWRSAQISHLLGIALVQALKRAKRYSDC